MNLLWKRRLNYSALAVCIALATLWLLRWDELRLGRSVFASGWLLGLFVCFLAAYGIRKKLSSLPLGSSAAWLQCHCYVALIALAVFLWHIGARWPDGWLEGTLALVFSLTFASGLFGLYLSRTIPAQLSRTGKEFIYERIPELRSANAERAREVVLQSVGESGQSTLADFFVERLYDYMVRPRSLVYLLIPNSRKRRVLMRELSEVDRFLSHSERVASEKLFRHVRRKDDLDYHQARQGLLKWWLFAHISLTVGLLVLGFWHMLVVLAFRGGVI